MNQHTLLAQSEPHLQSVNLGDIITETQNIPASRLFYSIWIYSETSIYRSQMYRFPESIVQFLWSLN
jgi:hypothetical protein